MPNIWGTTGDEDGDCYPDGWAAAKEEKEKLQAKADAWDELQEKKYGNSSGYGLQSYGHSPDWKKYKTLPINLEDIDQYPATWSDKYLPDTTKVGKGLTALSACLKIIQHAPPSMLPEMSVKLQGQFFVAVKAKKVCHNPTLYRLP